MSREKAIVRPDIFIYAATSIPTPARNRIHSVTRKALDRIAAGGQHVFILLGDGKVYQWGNFSFGPMFESWDAFINFYRNEPIEFGKHDNLFTWRDK